MARTRIVPELSIQILARSNDGVERFEHRSASEYDRYAPIDGVIRNWLTGASTSTFMC